MAYRSSTSGTGTSVVITAPAGVAEDDIIVCWWSKNGGGDTYTPPSGFSEPVEVVVDAAEFAAIDWSWKLATGSEPADYTFTGTYGAPLAWGAAAFSGRNTSSPIQASQPTDEPTGAASPLTIALTGVTAAAGDDLLWIAAQTSPDGSKFTYTEPGGFTKREEAKRFYGEAVLATLDSAAGGATGTLTGSAARDEGSADAAYGGFVIALAATGAGGITGSLTSTLDPLTSTSAGELDIAGLGGGALAPLTAVATAVLNITGSLSGSLAPLTSSSAGTLRISGALSQSLGTLTSTSAGDVDIEGLGNGALAPLTAAAQGVLSITGTLSATLADLTLTAAGGAPFDPILGILSATLSDATLEATGGEPDTERLFLSGPVRKRKIKVPVRAKAKLASTLDDATLLANAVLREKTEPVDDTAARNVVMQIEEDELWLAVL